MATRTQQITAATVMGIALMTGRHAIAQEQPLTVTVRVFSAGSNVPQEDLAEAYAKVTQVYEAAGVTLRWVDRGDQTGGAATYPVRLVLLSGKPAQQLIAERHVEDGVLGYAAGMARSAYVFCNRVVAAAGFRATSYVNVLGYAIAHELGHLLLPPNSHSSTGIMRPSLLLRAPRLAHFTDEQGALIRGLLMSASRSDEIQMAGTRAVDAH